MATFDVLDLSGYDSDEEIKKQVENLTTLVVEQQIMLAWLQGFVEGQSQRIDALEKRLVAVEQGKERRDV